jgi:hypothetical protein
VGLTKDEILKADDGDVAKVEVPEWNGHVYVRTMSGTERDKFEAAFVGRNGPMPMANIRAKLLVMTLCDEKGNRQFADTDVGVLGRKSAKALDRAFGEAMRLNGIGEEAIEELGKPSGGGQSEDSGTDSPDNAGQPLPKPSDN